MKTPLQRIRYGAFYLVLIFIAAVLGYRYFAGYEWIDAIWMVVVTISSVGYGEHSQLPPLVQLFTIAVILVGMSAAAYTIGGMLQLMLEGEFERALGIHRMTREIEDLRDHVIICGYGRIGEILAADLKRQKFRFVLVERNEARVQSAHDRQYLCLAGDATAEDVLTDAGIERAKTLFTGLPNDAANVFITLTARNLNPAIQIIARAAQPSTERKLRQAGADRVVLPTVIGAHHVERMITRPSTASLMELVAESSFTDLELDEVTIIEGCKLVGVTVLETEAHRTHRLLVVAVQNAAGAMTFNPDASYMFAPGDIAMVMGHSQDILRFRAQYQL